MWRLFLLLGIALHVHCQSLQSSPSEADRRAFELMSNRSLEDFCNSLGFELIEKDDPFSREDYINAAIQCYEISEEASRLSRDSVLSAYFPSPAPSELSWFLDNLSGSLTGHILINILSPPLPSWILPAPLLHDYELVWPRSA